MKNIWRIFTSDIRGLVKNPLALLIAGGLCVLPSLYAWFNIYSNWDPYANTANIKVAVATEDVGYTLSDGTYENMGDEVLEELKENEKIGWVFTGTADEALAGVYSGEYYAAVVISEDFTYSMYNVFREDFANPTITYYENEKRNAVATKITDTAVSTLKQSINQKFIEVVANNIFTQTNLLSDEMEDKNALETFEGKLAELNDNLISYSGMIDTFIQANAVLSASVSEANGNIADLSAKVGNGAANFAGAQSSLNSTQASLASFAQNAEQTMDAIKASIDQIAFDVNNTNLAASAQQTADALNQTMSDTSVLMDQLNGLSISLAQGNVEDERLQQVLETLSSLNGAASDIHDAVGSLVQNGTGTVVADSVNAAMGSLTQILATCSQSVTNMKDLYVNSLVPQMDNVLTGMSQMLGDVTMILRNLNDMMNDMGVVFTGIETTVNDTTESLKQLQTVIDRVSGKLTDLLERLDAAGEDEKLDILLEFLGGDPEQYGKFFAEPVQVTTEEIYPIPNYGSAMTPFYTVLALWVGGTILVALIKVKADPKELSDVKSYHLYFGRYLLFFVLGQLQAAVVVLGDIYLLHCHILYPGLFWLAAAFASFTFTLLIYTLALSFGDVGKALAVVVMVIQIAGSGGTFPIELLPQIYRNIYIFFPFPYAIGAMRETMGGMYGSDYMTYLAELLVFAAASLLVGLIIRLPFVRLNHFMEERMEETKLM